MTRARRGEPRARTKILEASRKLFSRRGFSETSMGDIARSAQVARATVYNNFDDKQDILAGIISDYMTGYARIPQKLRENARSGQTSFDLVQEMVREALGWRVQNADLRPIVAVARNLRGSGWDEADKAADDAMLGWIMAVHAADEAAGLIREDIDLEFGVRATYAMIEAILSNFDVSSDEEEIDRAAHQLALLHWYSICSVSPEDAPRSPLGRTAHA
ncbi:MAG TPA: helix-turn-helix domain-containing protein [Solirubrobacterales bacterium]